MRAPQLAGRAGLRVIQAELRHASSASDGMAGTLRHAGLFALVVPSAGGRASPQGSAASFAIAGVGLPRPSTRVGLRGGASIEPVTAGRLLQHGHALPTLVT